MTKLINTKWVAFVAIVLFFASCNNTTKSSDDNNSKVDSTQAVERPIGDNSQNALDWAGTYEGTVPCANCAGIKTTITLNADNTFSRTEEYLGEKGKPAQDNGTFEWDKEKSSITLKDKDRNQKYKVGENQLFHLDMSGNVITGDLADKYILRKKG
ncbi:copper resistance protein NlpE [uncultured Sunxiuqinia sp.]|uniref:copper resistance protein NlpE n=1 Tax=uncultured Sunxiuqinia sp. TaxID=1573825 RepID=UPI0026115EE7|nr:copper resistance protein NlpE [uncultured Sunxiuqinia sp.]